MTPADLATLREKAETMLDETHGQTCPFCTLARDILSLLSTFEAEQQQRARLEQALSMATAGQQALAEHVDVLRKLTEIYKSEAVDATSRARVAVAALTTGGPKHG